uniref:Transmembrane channel-like protein n=1 Tax=Mola mola TaxID=94237 RepID=A0A3Q3W1X3_MOLML
STYSSLSESCEYYQTEIYDQLPSIQANRSQWPKVKESTQPLRNLALCMQGKRDTRWDRVLNINFWESWRRSQSINVRRVLRQSRGALTGLKPGQHTLHAIEGRFGVGVKSYFVFVRYLVYLNLLHCFLIWSLILGPTAFYGREPLMFRGNDSFLDFILAKGYLDRSPVFFGFYSRGSLNMPCLNTPLLYVGGILTIFFLSFLIVVRRTIVGYKHTWMLVKRYSMNVSYKIFCGWDFTIQDPTSASLKQSFIRNDLKLFLEEQSFSLRKAQRTLRQRIRLYLLRFVLNMFVLSLLCGSFALIYVEQYAWWVNLILQYLPPMTISIVNVFLPQLFCKISSFEDYSFTMQVNTTLVRSVFLKLASLGIYLIFIYRTTKDQLIFVLLSQCRENKFGQEVYKLCIFSFLTTFTNAFFVSYPKKLLQEKYPLSMPARLLGNQYFLIQFNVLDLVYIQTVSWVGVYYCPLLPMIGTLTLTATFYINKFTVLRCCVAEQRMFRGSSSSVLFHLMLVIGLLMAGVSLGYNFYQQKVSPDMSTCGPFSNGETIFNMTEVCLRSLPGPAQTTLHYLTSEAFALPLVLAEVIILTSYVSRGRASKKAIERLKDMLVLSSSDKRFLVKQHATILRRQRNKNNTLSAIVKEAAGFNL